MLGRKFSLVVAAAAVMSLPAVAQQPATYAAPKATVQNPAAVPDGGVPQYIRAETPEQRRQRLGTPDDPGINPDPNAHYWRFGRSFHISRFDRALAVFNPQEPNMVRPRGAVNFTFEIYQQNEKYVWCWMPDPEVPDVPPGATQAPEPVPASRYTADVIAYFARVRPQFMPLMPADSTKTITFAESSEGLPTDGSWRNSLTVADMNEDGFLDLVTPPARKGDPVPHIFLGDGKGHWHEWAGVSWPHTLDYGGVAHGDFNKDGHVDLAFAVHLNGVSVFLGDGKGHFTESREGLPSDFPTRRVAVADIDGDGYPDIIASTEGPSAMEEGQTATHASLRAYINRKKGTAWEAVNVTPPDLYIGGDWLSIGDFNSDRQPDFLASSVYYGANQVAQLSAGPKKWKAFQADGELLPANSYFLANTVGKFTRKNDEAIIAYTRYWPTDLDSRIVATPALTEATCVDRLVFTKDGLQRTPIMRWGGHVGVHGIASGDFDGDGNLDVAVTREEFGQREVIILLGDGKGNFTKARVQGLPLQPNNIYDIKIADVNGDHRPDVILMYEALDIRREDFSRMPVETQAGSIHVFLNRGAKSAPADVKASK